MVEVRRKENESPETLIRRFTRQWQASGIGVRARQGRFYKKDYTKREKRIRALYRVEKKKEYELLHKLGKLEEEHFRKGKIYQRRSL